MNCWRALDAAARLAEAGQLTGTGQRWRGEAELIRRWVDEHCWSGHKQAYTFYAGTDELDASVLLGAEIGFDRWQRMSSTIDAITAELGAGPLLYRYTGAYQEEQTFLACAYWRVHALACVGRVDEGRQLSGELDELVPSPLGLLAEMSVAGHRRAGRQHAAGAEPPGSHPRRQRPTPRGNEPATVFGRQRPPPSPAKAAAIGMRMAAGTQPGAFRAASVPRTAPVTAVSRMPRLRSVPSGFLRSARPVNRAVR